MPVAPQVVEMSAHQLHRLMAEGPVELFDVRTHAERQIAVIRGARWLDGAGIAHLEALPRDTRVIFACHHGIRSRVAAERALAKGFTDVVNLTGGIEAWSRDVDPSVPRY